MKPSKAITSRQKHSLFQTNRAASNDKALLAEAQERAKVLLEDYVTNIGAAVGKEYSVDWIYLDAAGNPPDAAGTEASSDSDSGKAS